MMPAEQYRPTHRRPCPFCGSNGWFVDQTTGLIRACVCLPADTDENPPADVVARLLPAAPVSDIPQPEQWEPRPGIDNRVVEVLAWMLVGLVVVLVVVIVRGLS